MPSQGETLATLATLVGGRVEGDASVRVVDATHDSRQAGPGALFIAVRGLQMDGHDFAGAAVVSGAPAVVVQRVLPGLDVPQLVVADTRLAMAPISAAIHDRPSEHLRLVGVTGTNGKTTVTHLVESIATAAGLGTGLIGTVQTRAGRDIVPSLRTTPEATDFQRLLAEMLRRGADVVAAEVSSHALALGRVAATWFTVVAFTNLTQDHLDFHRTMEDYFQAKSELFAPERAARAVVWLDDAYGRRLASETRLPVLGVSLSSPADVTATVEGADLHGTDIRLSLAGDVVRPVRLRLPGRFNVANALMAAGCATALGIAPEVIADGLEALSAVPGRFEVVSGDDAVAVIVDYAHTPAGISGMVESARALGSGRVLVVVGAGGERDREKRPRMGEAAAAADVAVFTTDNPRSEDPEGILDEVMSGVPAGTDAHRVADRRTAIRFAIRMAAPGDTVLILGKGHERGQELADRIVPFDDRMVARQELALLRGEVHE